MALLQIALYIFFILVMVAVSIKVLWLVFFLFNFRIWESFVTYEWLSQYITFLTMRDYYILIVIASVMSYGLIWVASREVPILRYVFLVVMAIYTLFHYEIADIVFFKDFFERAGVWNWNYWKTQVIELLHFSVDDFLENVSMIWEGFWEGVKRFWGYAQGK